MLYVEEYGYPTVPIETATETTVQLKIILDNVDRPKPTVMVAIIHVQILQ